MPTTTTATRPAPRRLSTPLGFALVATIVGLALAASAAPSALYADYAARWDFSTTMLTLVYAVYAVGVLAALLLAGRLSDELGRRPVLVASLGVLLVAFVAFMLAESVVWLLVARTVQGIATGAVMGAAGAALIDLHPHGDARRAALVNGVASAAGIALGAFGATLVVQFVPDPLVTPYALVFALTAAALAATLALPETVERGPRPRLRPQRPHVPQPLWWVFALACGGVLASWSVGGLYLTLGPGLAQELMHTTNHLAGGVAILALAGVAVPAQLLLHRLPAEQAMRQGALALAIGMAGLVAALGIGSAAAFLLATAVTGAGFGVAFMGAVRLVSMAAPIHQRAAVMSAFYIAAYLALSLPVVLAGVATGPFGLEPTFRAFAAIVAAIALVTAVGAHRAGRRPTATSAC